MAYFVFLCPLELPFLSTLGLKWDFDFGPQRDRSQPAGLLVLVNEERVRPIGVFHIPPNITAKNAIAHQTSGFELCQDLDKSHNGLVQWHFKAKRGRCGDSFSRKCRHASENIRPAYDFPSLFRPKVRHALLPLTLKLPSSSRPFQMIENDRIE